MIARGTQSRVLASALTAALAVLPRIDAAAEVAHDFGLDPDLRGTLRLAFDARALAGDGWHFDIFTEVRSTVRENRGRESPVRVSPQQIGYPVGGRLRFPLGGEREWGLFAFHRSNHDVDEGDPELLTETIAYEVYGADWVLPPLRLAAGVYYDRGTTRAQKRQTLPFDYYLFGVRAEADVPLGERAFTGGVFEAIAQRNAGHAPAYVNLQGHLDVGALWRGSAGAWRVFLRFERIEDYRFLGDDPHHLLMLGTAIGARSP